MALLSHTFLHIRLLLLLQVHQLDEQTWRTVEVVPIDIANNEEVAQGVSDLVEAGCADVGRQSVSTPRERRTHAN